MSLPVTVDLCRRHIAVHLQRPPHENPCIQRARELGVQQKVARLDAEQLRELCALLGLRVPKTFSTFNGRSAPLDAIKKYVEQRGKV